MKAIDQIDKHEADEETVRLLQSGNEAAFRQLVEAYQNKVYNLCLGFLKNETDAEDVAQEVFVEVYRSIHQFNNDSGLGTWIYRISVNKSLEFLRKSKRKKRFSWLTSIFGNEEVLESQTADFEHPGVSLENKERSKILMEHIDRLPKNQKVAFTLHKLEDLSYKEVSDIMQVSISSVESLMFRAKKNLKNTLKDYYKEL
ncbi:RNA polymerase sigma factor [Fulvivirga ligni]|uniref:RNA polymerase sigma factor n=1 Tax=Fulvivirga ligni TaxID=2904246 RepID=UPI001F2E4624|nr:sigma-70 family RNA polymerase sigma factor [Fulvivirga ligni]UII23105.1 sigma-70 family RNA polymerase sigma factor [Fulvivirga ligni]